MAMSPFLPGCACGTYECSRAQENTSWCEDDVLLSCRGGDDPDGGWNRYLSRVDCAGMGMVCLPFEADLIATCAPMEDLCVPEMEAAGACRAEGDATTLYTCTPQETCEPSLECRERYSCEAPPRCVQWGIWESSGQLCEACTSHCGCAAGFSCSEDGLCQPGEPPADLRCCDRARGGTCPVGEACTTFEGEVSTCAGGERCDVCEGIGDCAELDCVTLEGRPTSVCLDPVEGSMVTSTCVVSDEGAHEIWSQNICGDLISLEETCDAQSICTDATCGRLWPEIEVNPTLLDLPDTMVGDTSTRQLSIGNLGDIVLNVSSITLMSETPDVFEISLTEATVMVDEIVTLDVSFTPIEAGDFTARILIESDDEDEPEVQVLVNVTAL
ncbi:MAG: choice-of-anchor D domain-containing protein [Bradymonadia bacterium]